MTRHTTELPQDAILIVVSSDENYARHMGVMFVSLLENTSRPDRCRLFVIDGGIREETRQTVEHEVQKRNGTVTFLKFDGSEYDNYHLRRGMTAAAYYRISIPDLFPESVEKVIYLDCDLIVKGDIADLWDLPLNGNPIAAVQDLSNSTYKASGLAQHQYFNSGVMPMDLSLWRRDNIAEKVRRFKKEHPEKISTNDQCALNGILHDAWTRLPLRWNQQSGIYRPTRGRLRHFAGEEIRKALWSPGIIHYIGSGKPWKYPCFHPLAEEYFRYQNRTAWAGGKKQEIPLRAFLAWSLKPKNLRKYLRQKRWQKKYAKFDKKESPNFGDV